MYGPQTIYPSESDQDSVILEVPLTTCNLPTQTLLYRLSVKFTDLKTVRTENIVPRVVQVQLY